MVRTTTAKEPVKAQYHIKAQTLLSWALKSSDLEWFQGPSCKRFPVWVSVKKGQQSGSISPNLANPVTLKYNDKAILFQYLHASFHRVVEDRAGNRQPDLQNTKCKPKYNEITVGLCLLTQSHEQPKALCRLPCFHLHLVTYSKIHQTYNSVLQAHHFTAELTVLMKQSSIFGLCLSTTLTRHHQNCHRSLGSATYTMWEKQKSAETRCPNPDWTIP